MKEILQLMAQGLTKDRIAETLHMSTAMSSTIHSSSTVVWRFPVRQRPCGKQEEGDVYETYERKLARQPSLVVLYIHSVCKPAFSSGNAGAGVGICDGGKKPCCSCDR